MPVRVAAVGNMKAGPMITEILEASREVNLVLNQGVGNYLHLAQRIHDMLTERGNAIEVLISDQ